MDDVADHVDPRLRNLTNRKICASLLLQQLLYYNMFWSPAWFLFRIVRVFYLYAHGLQVSDPDVVRMVLMTFWTLAEPLRLSAGYYGNLKENVPWLLIFGVLSLAPQVPVCYYLMMVQYDLKPIDKAVQIVMALIIHIEFFVAIYAVRRVLKVQEGQFYLLEYALTQQHNQRQVPEHAPQPDNMTSVQAARS